MADATTNNSPISANQLGILFGVIMVLEFVISYVLNIDPISNPMAGTLMNVGNYLVFPVLFIFLACNNYKKSHSGYISFSQCLKTGVMVCLIASLIFGIFNGIFMTLFPEFAEEILRKTRSVMIEKSPQMTQEQVDMAIGMTRKFMNPLFSTPITVLMYCFIGLIYSLIIGAIVKKDPPHSL